MKNMAPSSDESSDVYVQMLQEEGVSFEDAVVIDVGCGNGHFVEYAKRKLDVKQAWGVDHYPDIVKKGYKDGVLSEADRKRVLVAAFSKVLGKEQLKDHFDIVKITSVTSFASAFEMRRMLPAAHFLLKDSGALLLELPTVNLMGKAYQANGSDAAVVQLNRRCAFDPVAERAFRKQGDELADIYSQLTSIFFEETSVKSGIAGVKSIVAKVPRSNPPELKDITYNLRKAELTLTGRAQEIARSLD